MVLIDIHGESASFAGIIGELLPAGILFLERILLIESQLGEPSIIFEVEDQLFRWNIGER